MTRDDALAGFALTEPAPAKINLALHVTGQRADGYHLLDSLVTFTRFGDRIGVSPAEVDAFSLSGPFAGPLSQTDDNLVIRARDLLREAALAAGGDAPPVHIHLEKNMPVASGIGGGSADAAATLRCLARLWDVRSVDLAALGLRLGADVPMCILSRPLVARGIGEALTSVPGLPAFALVLVNPLTGVSTPAIFRALQNKDNAPLDLAAAPADENAWIAMLDSARNDLAAPARALCPEIADIETALTATGARLVRMSGSGATCFGLYRDPDEAERAATTLAAQHPCRFIQATTSFSGGTDVTDR
jgi:4-diphosphocytidyl-2-C-methyl-D-erythritol kinase